jgi:hypothetical protein
MLAKSVPLSAAAQLAGAAPERISRVGDAPVVLSTASRQAFLTAVEY